MVEITARDNKQLLLETAEINVGPLPIKQCTAKQECR